MVKKAKKCQLPRLKQAEDQKNDKQPANFINTEKDTRSRVVLVNIVIASFTVNPLDQFAMRSNTIRKVGKTCLK